jgi:hypothetical protein
MVVIVKPNLRGGVRGVLLVSESLYASFMNIFDT